MWWRHVVWWRHMVRWRGVIRWRGAMTRLMTSRDDVAWWRHVTTHSNGIEKGGPGGSPSAGRLYKCRELERVQDAGCRFVRNYTLPDLVQLALTLRSDQSARLLFRTRAARQTRAVRQSRTVGQTRAVRELRTGFHMDDVGSQVATLEQKKEDVAIGRCYWVCRLRYTLLDCITSLACWALTRCNLWRST